MSHRIAPWWAIPCFLLLAAAAPAPTPATNPATTSAGASAGPTGRWDGVVLANPGRNELDLTLEIAREANQWVGYLSVPAQAITHRRLDDLKFEDQKLTFLYKDPSGDSQFIGFLAADDSISGDFSEGGRTILCRFWRAAEDGAQAKTLPLVNLGEDGAELRQAFNDDKAHPRLVMVLSPTCHDCRASALMVQRTLLARGRFPDLRVYVVWEPAQGQDKKEGAAAASALIRDDARARQFWSESRYVGKAFKEQLNFIATPAWDVFLVFAPGAQWTTEAPKAALAMNNRNPDQELHFDTNRLAAKIKELSAEPK